MENKTETKEAIVRGNNVGISTKHSIVICKFLKGKKLADAVKELEDVVKMKRIIPMVGYEIPHKKGVPGRYPVKAAKVFVKLLKNLEANANIKGVDIHTAKLSAKADKASRPRRAGKYPGRKFKRTHILITLK